VTPTHHPSDRPLSQYDHHHKNPTQSTYQPTIKIKNCNAHLGIMIRWTQEPGQNRHQQLILKPRTFDLVVVG
jgi:hypothetical protein